jgi:hypothetical protein
VVRRGREAARPAVADPRGAPEPAPLALAPARPGTALADPVLVAEAAAAVARPFGVAPEVLSLDVLWSGELTRTGGLGTVVVLATRVPGSAHVLTAQARVGEVRGGLPVPCGTTSYPAEAPVSTLTLAVVCSIPDGTGSGAGPDRTWLVVTAPPDGVAAQVLDADGGVLDVLPLDRGGGMTRTPDGAAAVRVLGSDGLSRDIVPVTPAAEEPFGDYGDG